MLVPKLRFKEFTDEWKKENLKKLCNFYSGGTPTSTNKKYYNGNIPFIRSGEIALDSTQLYISELGLKNSSAKLVYKGDLLYALYGATSGEVSISKINGAINQAILCIKPFNNINANFINYFLKNKKNFIINTFLQGGQGNLSAEIIKKLELIYPKENEQNKIANFLSLLDKKIELQTRKIEVLKLYKTGLSNKIFNKKNMINWNEKTIKDLGNLITAKSKINTIDETGIYNIVDMGTVNFEGKLLKHKKTNCNYDILKLGDLIIPKDDIGGGLIIGKCAYIDEENKYILSDHLYMLRCENENTLFISYQINSLYINQQLKKKVTGSAQLGLNAKNIYEQSLFFPDKVLQAKISNSLYSIDKRIDKEKVKEELLNQLKKGLMQQLFV